ncbi:transcription regulator containing HTH domain [Aeropyrum camini]|uniref:Predicted transcription regulator containing HTH domain n=1 Tax=Aeropyrum camini SY1 = JCM 12091 TaxID=1198449 RepID=U3TE36_9CREN|nr:transcription regulator containing HTH domain [Aeropyrum camini]BAN90218.1 predicted transcription regulator containing HTH domain [Aeropyrum camini SY1 = JCM 12091]
MDRDRLVGFGLLIGSLAVIIVYAYLVFFTGWWELVIKLTGLMAVAGFFGLLAWVGYVLATTPPPKPIEEIEKEIEEELKRLERELEGEGKEVEGKQSGEKPEKAVKSEERESGRA